ncbi:hypothetical protein CMI43_03585, partial [Candidatus Pacearchaeota archaeon]|nr:hypothetical protein [Candidatus Pacearchaeota archaeon]
KKKGINVNIVILIIVVVLVIVLVWGVFYKAPVESGEGELAQMGPGSGMPVRGVGGEGGMPGSGCTCECIKENKQFPNIPNQKLCKKVNEETKTCDTYDFEITAKNFNECSKSEGGKCDGSQAGEPLPKGGNSWRKTSGKYANCKYS